MTDAERLESHIAHLSAQLEDLSAVVARQDTELDRLKARVEMLLRREAEREADGGGGHAFGDETPPHY
ncbi:SlyX protein [Roseivivax halodurans JCM 10272]|uniref:SlyX protein n=1 Tax=Roseivivax halodurans JCM 10272 TaxID=1449350 RepID=X7EI33_9RHOB|nr:SlyX family protein [Roseivivax halodurans]ETX14826.1 SlyX protein [Roseivivax halodurans JCM 10272]